MSSLLSWIARAITPTPRWSIGLFGLVVTVGLIAILASELLVNRFVLTEGEVATLLIKSPRRVEFQSNIQTDAARREAADAINLPMRYDDSIAEASQAELTETMGLIEGLRVTTGDLSTRAALVSQIPGVRITQDEATELLKLPEDEWRQVQLESLRTTQRTMRNQIIEAQVEEAHQAAMLHVSADLNDRQTTLVRSLSRAFVRANYLIDESAAEQAKLAASDSVEPVIATVEAGETIVRDGEIIRPEHLEKLAAVGLNDIRVDMREFGARAGLLIAIIAIFVGYLASYREKRFQRAGPLILLGLILLLTVGLARATPIQTDLKAVVFPFAAATMLVSVLLGTRLAVVMGVIAAFAVSVIEGANFQLAPQLFITGTVGALLVRRIVRVNHLFLAGLVVGLSALATGSAFHLMIGDLERLSVLTILIAALVNGVLSSIIAVGTMTILGQVFGITTTIGLLELAHPSQPLFRRLLTEAPGTYHHSIVVANLAEASAEAIGADALLCRISAYYHDIGKLNRPYAFSENQFGGENIHDELQPLLSAKIIIAHAREGYLLGKEHGLPNRVLELIAQHHGTTQVAYFYQKALASGELPVDESRYRYPGPRPQTREAGIMMLADGIEATVRSAPDQSPETVASMLEKMFQVRITDGQLSECDLTLRDLEDIKKSLSSVLQGIYHPRVEYPSADELQEAEQPPKLLEPSKS